MFDCHRSRETVPVAARDPDRRIVLRKQEANREQRGAGELDRYCTRNTGLISLFYRSLVNVEFSFISTNLVGNFNYRIYQIFFLLLHVI